MRRIMTESTPNFTPYHFAPLPFDPIVSNGLEISVAQTVADVEEAQRLRFDVFYREMGAIAHADIMAQARDFDEFDNVCDHLLVWNVQPNGEREVVGTYRLLRSASMPKVGRFYSEDEYDISLLKSASGNLVELGRSCVKHEFRTRPTMQALWKGLGAYLAAYDIAFMFGCASFTGADPQTHSEALAYLHAHHLAPADVCPKALAERYVPMAGDVQTMDVKRAFMALPTMIKGYLRAGAMIGDGAVIDADFNTVDVSVVMNTAMIRGKYASRYVADNQSS